MSAISSYPFVMLLVAAAALVVAWVALLAARRLHRELVAVRAELAGHRAEVAETVASATAGMVPAARSAERAERAEEIRSAVAEALADERDRELAEARAFWAAQEACEAEGVPLLDGVSGLDSVNGPSGTGGLSGLNLDGMHTLDGLEGAAGFDGLDGTESPGSAAYLDLPEFEVLPLLPRQSDHLGTDHLGTDPDAPPVPHRRHPSDPDFTPSPVVADPEQTVARLTELAEARVPLADVRPGPLGTLDLYVFTDGTTLCLTPGHSETADRLAAALERGEAPILLGGSGISGAYALTFTYGTESVFILADRVVASL